jgi:hypothetical protein
MRTQATDICLKATSDEYSNSTVPSGQQMALLIRLTSSGIMSLSFIGLTLRFACESAGILPARHSQVKALVS